MGLGERILLVEDSQDLRETLEAWLSRDGHEVVAQAGNMEDALRCISTAPELGVTVGVLDGNLTEGDISCNDGRNIAEKLRAAVPGIKIVSCSSSSNADYRDVMVDKRDTRNFTAQLRTAITGL